MIRQRGDQLLKVEEMQPTEWQRQHQAELENEITVLQSLAHQTEKFLEDKKRYENECALAQTTPTREKYQPLLIEPTFDSLAQRYGIDIYDIRELLSDSILHRSEREEYRCALKQINRNLRTQRALNFRDPNQVLSSMSRKKSSIK